MKHSWGWLFLAAFAAFAHPAAQTAQNLPAAPAQPSLEILNFEVGSDYYPILDRRSSTMTADNPDFPKLEAERRRRSGAKGDIAERIEESKSRGRLRSSIKVVDQAQWVKVLVKNAGEKPIKAVVWDFAFPRFEGDKIVLRYDVSSSVEIKPRKKKMLKQALPAGARGCEMVVVRADASGNATKGYYGGVCGDPLAMREPAAMNQEAVIIKRIEYADGSVWERP